MSLRETTAELARELAALAAAGPADTLSAGDLHAALSARRTLLPLLRSVVGDMTATPDDARPVITGPWVARVRLTEELVTHPVALLTRALIDYPAPRSPSAFGDTRAPEPETTTGRAWERIRGHAEAAARAWSAMTPILAPEAQRWSAVADVAAICEALCVADEHLLAGAHRSPDLERTAVSELSAVDTALLRFAAHETIELARSGPLPEWAHSRPEPRPPIAIRSPDDLGPVQLNIAAQLAAADCVSPRAIAALATSQATVLAIAAEALRDTDPARADQAARLAHGLGAVSHDNRRLTMSLLGDRRPAVQCAELVDRVTAAHRRGWDHPHSAGYRAALADVIDHAPAVIRALATRTVRALAAREWLVPDTSLAPATTWRPFDPIHDPVPPLAKGLSALASHARATPDLGLDPTPTPPLRDALAHVAAYRQRSRPAHPASRVTPRRGR